MSTDLEITQLARLLREREVSSEEITRDFLRRIEQLNPRLDAYISVTAEEAMNQARQADAEVSAGTYRGPLHGVPIGIKDLFDMGGVPTTFGSRILKDNIASQDSAVVNRLRDAGAVILGKHNLHEFAFGITSENPHFGAVRNPWDRDRVPGGSSGGTASAVAAGLCAAGIGSDTGASIRVPASFCGVVGLKPTFGRVSRTGGLPLAWSLDHAGPIARSVADCAWMLQAIAGYDASDAGSANVPVPDSPSDSALASLVCGLASRASTSST